MPVFEKKSTSISAISLSVDLWLIKMVGFISTSLTFPAYLIGISVLDSLYHSIGLIVASINAISSSVRLYFA